MKKIIALVSVVLLALLLIACGEVETPPEPKPDPAPTPIVRGDSALIFGANSAFTLV